MHHWGKTANYSFRILILCCLPGCVSPIVHVCVVYGPNENMLGFKRFTQNNSDLYYAVLSFVA